jgi:hypothetical protein
MLKKLEHLKVTEKNLDDEIFKILGYRVTYEDLVKLYE